MWPILLLAGGAFLVYELVAKSSPALTAAQAQANAGLVAANANLANAQTPGAYDPNNPATYGGSGTPSTATPPDWGPPVAAQPSGIAQGTPAGTSTAGAPLFHTGAADASGAPIAIDANGNPYLMC
jgi:hypothetical protein